METIRMCICLQPGAYLLANFAYGEVQPALPVLHAS